MVKSVLVLIITLFISHLADSQAPVIEKYVEWSQKDYIIQNVTFNHQNSEIAFVRRFNMPDSIAKNPAADDRFTENLLPKQNRDLRKRDPVIAKLSLGSKRVQLIDYGWSPNFSPNDTRLVYSYQKEPIGEQKIVATAFKGNGIRIFNTITKKTDILYSPPSINGFLMDPVFIDSLNVVYKNGDAVNGPYAGGISFSKINIKSKNPQIIRPAKIQYRLYDLMGEIYHIDSSRIAYTVYSPQDAANGMANEYSHLLMDGNDTVFNFGIRPFNNLEYKFALRPQHEIIYLDDNHLMAGDTNYVQQYQYGQLGYKRMLDFNYIKAYLSPDGKNILYITPEMDAYLFNIASSAKTKIPLPKKQFYATTWSADGRWFTIVQAHEHLPQTDVLYVYKII